MSVKIHILVPVIILRFLFALQSDMAMPRPTVTPSDWVLPRISVEAVESLRAKYEKEASVLHERWSQHLPTLRYCNKTAFDDEQMKC